MRRSACRLPADLTIGFGPGLFRDATARTGSAWPTGSPRRCGRCRTSPATTSTRPARGGDLCVQACADDPQVAVHAIRNLARIGFGTVAVRWSQLGLRADVVDLTAQATPRNLFGFKDGTANLKAEETDDARRAPLGRARRRPARLDGRRHLPGGPADPDEHRDLGPHVAAASRRPSSAGPRATARRCRAAASSARSTSRITGATAAADPDDSHVPLAHPTSTTAPAAAPRLQLRRRLRRPRPPRRGAVLHRVPAGPAHPVHPDADRSWRARTG